MKSKLFGAIIILAIFATTVKAQSKAAPTLNGTSYKIQITDLAKPTEVKPDMVSFSDKMFTSENSAAKGFGKTSFLEKVGVDGIYFQAIFSSEKEGVMTWKGSVKENVIEGKVLWEKNGLEPIKYSYTGEATATDKK